MSDGDLTPRPLKVRRQRPNKNRIPRTHRYLHENGLPSPADLPPQHVEERRAVSSNVAVNSQALSLQTDLAMNIRRQPSLKHRLLNRMASGFSSRILSDIVSEQAKSASTLKSNRDDSRRSSESSVSNARSLMDLDGALAFFPTPPTSVATSPKTERSFKSTTSPEQSHRELAVPQKQGILVAEIKVVPFHDTEKMDYSNGAVIEITARIHGEALNPELRSQRHALDVVVVIDNSLFNCPAQLMTSSEITSMIASNLESTTDRIAILCTMPTDSKQETHDSTLVAELNWVSPKSLKVAVDTIASSTVQPDQEVLGKAIKRAQQILLGSERLQIFGASSYETFGHVIVLTADASSLSGEDLKNDTIQTHVLCTGVPQFRVWDKIQCNGWKMCLLNPFLNGAGPFNSRAKRGRHSRSLGDKLQALIQHARSGHQVECLSDVVVELEVQAGCTKERVLGRTKFPRMQIGETKVIVVSLISEARSTSLDDMEDHDGRGLNALNTDEDLMGEIGHMLGFPKDTTLTVNLRYMHPSMPRNTFCTASAKSLIQMQSSSPNYKQSVPKQLADKGTFVLHQRLAEYYASYYPPRDALSSLWREFGLDGSRSACPVYINTLADELKYQARIAERIAIENSPQKIVRGSVRSPPTRLSTGWSRKSSRNIENHKPITWARDSDSEPHTPDGSHIKVVEQLGLDDARKIWSDLRHMSKGEVSDNRDDSPSSPITQARCKIAETVLRGQKSLSELKLKKLVAHPQRVTKSTLFPPWV